MRTVFAWYQPVSLSRTRCAPERFEAPTTPRCFSCSRLRARRAAASSRLPFLQQVHSVIARNFTLVLTKNLLCYCPRIYSVMGAFQAVDRMRADQHNSGGFKPWHAGVDLFECHRVGIHPELLVGGRSDAHELAGLDVRQRGGPLIQIHWGQCACARGTLLLLYRVACSPKSQRWHERDSMAVF